MSDTNNNNNNSSSSNADLAALLAQQEEKGAAVKKLKTEGVTGAELSAAISELADVKAQILPILEAQYNAETDEAKKEALAPKLRGYMDKKQQKVFDKQRKKARAAAAAGGAGGGAGNNQAGNGGEGGMTKKQLAKLEKKRKKQAAIAAKKNGGGGTSGGANKNEKQQKNKGAAKKREGPAVHFSHAEGAPLPLVAYIAASLSQSTEAPEFEATLDGADSQARFQPASGAELVGDLAIARHVAGELYPSAARTSIETLLAFSSTVGTTPETLAQAIGTLNAMLERRTYLADDAGDGSIGMSLADVAVFVALHKRGLKRGIADLAGSAPHVVRWFNMCLANKAFTSANGKVNNIAKRARLAAARNAKTDNYQELEGAVMGKVVTRFPPEPSGYLHIGHVKAALLNEFYARKYKGKLILRFDDTNPSKEKAEFENAIIADLATLGIKPDQVTYTSDSFPLIADYARKLIKQGDAYMDDTPQLQMQEERLNCINSVHREQSVEETLELFEALLKGEKRAQPFCLRARMSMQDDNACLRDPVFFRYNPLAHHRTGTKYKAYPTYDFACPIVDSIEGVTHAMRTNEYRQRIPQNMWVVDKLKLRKYRIQEFGRLNFEFTLMSKRKLTQLVANGEVDGWDDPRFPTVRGMIRRGVQLPVLREFILSQGFSARLVTMKWDKYWSSNKKYLEPRARRFMAIAKDTAVTLRLTNVPAGLVSLRVPVHPKDKTLGMRPFFLGNELWIEQGDAQAMVEGKEVTLMQWGNAIIDKIHRDSSGAVTEVEGRSNVEGDVKSTDLKICFVAKAADTVAVDMVDFDFLINKAKMEEEDDLADCLTSNDHPTRTCTRMIGEPALRAVAQDQIVQIMRRGMTRCDRALPATGDVADAALQLFVIPDGKTKAMSAMATGAESIARRN